MTRKAVAGIERHSSPAAGFARMSRSIYTSPEESFHLNNQQGLALAAFDCPRRTQCGTGQLTARPRAMRHVCSWLPWHPRATCCTNAEDDVEHKQQALVPAGEAGALAPAETA